MVIFIAFAVSHFAKKGISPGPGPEPPEPFLPEGIEKAQVFTYSGQKPLCQKSVQYDGIKNFTIYFDIDYILSQYEKKIFYYFNIDSNCITVPNSFNITLPLSYDEFTQKNGASSEYFYAIENFLSESAILSQFGASDFEEIFPFVPFGTQSVQILVTNLCNTGSGTDLNGYVSPTRLITINYNNYTYTDDTFSDEACNDISSFNVNAPILYNTFYSTGTTNQFFYAKQNFTTINNLLAQFNATDFTLDNT